MDDFAQKLHLWATGDKLAVLERSSNAGSGPYDSRSIIEELELPDDPTNSSNRLCWFKV